VALFYSILEVAIFSFLLSVLYRQSYNLLFFYLKKPLLWILFVGFLPILWFSLGVIFHLSPTVVWWSSIIALGLNITPQNNLAKKEMREFADEFTEVPNSIQKSRYGRICFAIGIAVGWILFVR
jgi:hypothetical protein